MPNGEELKHESRANMPLFLLRNYAWGKIYAMLFGYRKDSAIENNPSFLITKKVEKRTRTRTRRRTPRATNCPSRLGRASSRSARTSPLTSGS